MSNIDQPIINEKSVIYDKLINFTPPVPVTKGFVCKKTHTTRYMCMGHIFNSDDILMSMEYISIGETYQYSGWPWHGRHTDDITYFIEYG